jgi:hypothetical protein
MVIEPLAQIDGVAEGNEGENPRPSKNSTPLTASNSVILIPSRDDSETIVDRLIRMSPIINIYPYFDHGTSFSFFRGSLSHEQNLF